VGSPADGTTQAPLAENVLCAYPPDWVPYVVQEGDTLEALATMYGIDGGVIVTNNCLYATGTPPPGSTIYLPATKVAVEGEGATAEATATSETEAAATTSEQTSNEGSCKSPYTVRGGEWVYKIARRCNINPYSIIQANGLAAPYWLRPGQVLVLPKNAPPFPK
jgi:LysM repeat protein